jgi:hypothetical protein
MEALHDSGLPKALQAGYEVAIGDYLDYCRLDD